MNLKARLQQPAIVVAPGVYDAFGALLAERAGFDALYLSGASIAYTRLGRPDIGLTTFTEVADTLAHITERTARPVIVDADTGFGNALNVQRTVSVLERAGAAGIQLEDQTMPKRCGHLRGKSLVSTDEMVGKIKAARDACKRDDTVIIARTDAVAVEGFDAAIERAQRYREAGADLLFIEALESREQMQAAVDRFRDNAPLMTNIVEGGRTPALPAPELQAIGFALVIFPGGLVRALAHAAAAYFDNLRTHGNNEAFRDRMLDFDALNELLGTPELLALGKQYDADSLQQGKQQ